MATYAKKIGFIGAGKVGWSLGRYIHTEAGPSFELLGYHSKSAGSAAGAAAFAGGRAYDTAEELAAECDLLLLTVPDNRIEALWEGLSGTLPEKRRSPLFIGHCNGSLSAGVFRTKPPGCFFGSIHPLLAVYDRENSYENFSGAFFTIEGDDSFIGLAKSLVEALGNQYCIIDAAQKTRYHAASVMVSNLVCGLAYTGMETFRTCGLDDSFAESAWRTLFLGNAENIEKAGPVAALTGPVERGDTETVARHIEALTGDEKEMYVLLSRTLIEAAKRKNPERDYTDMARLLGSGGKV